MFKFLRSLVNNEVMGEEIVEANVKTYYQAKAMHPELGPMGWLVATYLGRQQARGDTPSQFDAEYHCSKFEKLSEPQNARALGLTMLCQERMDIFTEYPKFSEELARYID